MLKSKTHQNFLVEAWWGQLVASRDSARIHAVAAVLMQQRRIVQRHTPHEG